MLTFSEALDAASVPPAERGFSGSLAWALKPSSARGAKLPLTQTIGGASSGGGRDDSLGWRLVRGGSGGAQACHQVDDLLHGPAERIQSIPTKIGQARAEYGSNPLAEQSNGNRGDLPIAGRDQNFNDFSVGHRHAHQAFRLWFFL